MALLFISHNLAVVRHLCEDIAVLCRGRLVERAGRDQLFSDPRDPYTRALLAAVPEPRARTGASRPRR
jgi:ABC-type dipeptide/oligopeptide/nickel transport system ATPase component